MISQSHDNSIRNGSVVVPLNFLEVKLDEEDTCFQTENVALQFEKAFRKNVTLEIRIKFI